MSLHRIQETQQEQPKRKPLVGKSDFKVAIEHKHELYYVDKSLLIEGERYLFACGQYIENNPVKAKMVKKANDWLYSSS